MIAVGLAVAAIVAAAVMCIAAPVGVSIGAVAVLAGPHNWLEGRYLLTKMPPRWGRLSAFFALAAAGVTVLTLGQAALAWRPSVGGTRTWLLAVIAWATALAVLRAGQNPRRPALDWAIPVGLMAAAFAVALPAWAALSLVYAHPLASLLFLDRELPPRWRPAVRRGLWLVPIAAAVVFVALSGGTGSDRSPLLARQAGAELIGLPSDALIGTHAFLELLHYGVWIVAVPRLARLSLISLDDVPLRRSRWRPLVIGTLAGGLAVVVLLWVGFAVDPALTRRLYFTLAIGHVLAEIPFALRAA